MAQQPLIDSNVQNNITPYNSTNFENKSINPVSQNIQQPNYTPQDLNIPITQPLCTPSQGTDFSINQNTPGIISTQYQNYKNISEIPHKFIQQIDSNSFFFPISSDCCSKCSPFIFLIVGFSQLIIYCLLTIFVLKSFWEPTLIMLIVGIAFSLFGTYSLFKTYHSIYIYIEQNSLKVMKKAICGNNIKIYNSGELERVDFLYKYDYVIDNEGEGSYVHQYNLIFVPKREQVDKIFSIGNRDKIFTQEEMDYFQYIMNNHIKTEMK